MFLFFITATIDVLAIAPAIAIIDVAVAAAIARVATAARTVAFTFVADDVATAFVVAACAAVVAATTTYSTNATSIAHDACDVKELKAEWRHQKTRIFTELSKDRQVHIRGHKVIT